jgi:hypothetical protein
MKTNRLRTNVTVSLLIYHAVLGKWVYSTCIRLKIFGNKDADADIEQRNKMLMSLDLTGVAKEVGVPSKLMSM